MSFKTWSIYAAPASVALIVLALWIGNKSDGANQTASTVQQDAPQHPQKVERTAATSASSAEWNVERPAAIPASAAEWTEIQKFVRSIWAIGTRQGRAQETLKTTVASSVKTLDLNRIRKAQIKYIAQLDEALAALDHVRVPKVANEDGAKFIATAFENLNAVLLLEQEQTDSFVKGLADSSQMPSNEEIANMNDDINRKTALLVISLHRIYWNYGYSDEDFDKNTFALKKGAKPQPTVSFNRGDS